MIEFPPILGSILEEHEKSGVDISSLRAVTGLEVPETIEKYQTMTGGTFYVMYGQTETSCLATYGSYHERPGSAGKALPMAEVRLVDDYDRPVATGQDRGNRGEGSHGVSRLLEPSGGQRIYLQGRDGITPVTRESSTKMAISGMQAARPKRN